MLLVALATFLLFTYLSYRRPILALSALAALLPTYLLRFTVFGLPSTMLEFIIWGTFLGWAIKFKVQSSKFKVLLFPRLQKIKYPLALFFIASAISVFVAPDFIKALGLWRAFFLEPILVFLMILAVVPPTLLPLGKGEERGGGEKTEPRSEGPWPSTTGVIFGLSISAFYLSAISIGQKIFGLPNPFLENTARVSSVFPQPNMLGLYLGPLIPLFFYKLIFNFQFSIFNKFSIKKFLIFSYWILTIILSIVAIIFAQSDGAIIGVIGAAAVFLLLWNKKTRLLLIVSAILLTTYYLLLPNSNLILAIKTKLLFGSWSGTVRLQIWRESWAMLKDNWLWGAGIAGYAVKILPYHASHGWMDVFQYPHNIIFNFWSELGILGLAAFLWLLEKFYKICYKLISPERAESRGYIITAVAAMSALVIHGLVDIPYFKNDLSILFWIIYAMPFIASSHSSVIPDPRPVPRSSQGEVGSGTIRESS